MEKEANVNIEAENQTAEGQDNTSEESIVTPKTETNTAEADTTATAEDISAFEELWGGKSFTEAELMGEDLVASEEEGEPSGAKETEDAPPKDEEKTADDSGEDSSKQKDEGDKEEKTEETEEDDSSKKELDTSDKKPPAGFVPYEALFEERERRKQALEEALKWKEIAEGKIAAADQTGKGVGLQQHTEASKGKVPIPDEIKDDAREFCRLYPEYAELLTEDSPDGERLRYRLESFGVDGAFDAAESIIVRRKFDEIQKSYQQTEQERAREAEKSYIMRCEQELAATIPGLYQDPNVATTLVDFAIEHGFNKDFLGLLTDPGTKIIPSGESPEKSVLLGEGAIGVVKALYALKQKLENTPKLEEIKKQVEAELRPKITQEILNKVQKNPGYRGLDDVPSTKTSTPTSVKGLLSEKELSKLSDAELAKYLSGA